MAFNVIAIPTKRIKNQTGRRFGRLTVVGLVGFNRQNAALWGCSCDCGGKTTVSTGELNRAGQDASGRTRRGVRSCGCLQPDTAIITHTTHGMTSAPEYQAWSSMIQRCENPNAGEYQRYGARGITISSAWRQSFEAFLAYIGHRPTDNHSLDRIDPNGNYEPGNVRWATKTTQQRNRRVNRFVPFGSEMVTLAEAAERSGLDKGTIRARLRRGWPAERLYAPT